MGLRPQDRERGLATLNEARQTRRRAIVFGRVRVREVATGFWLMTFAGLVIFSIAYYRYTLVELDARRSEVLARQRAIASAVGGDGLALRDKLEGWVMDLGAGKLPVQVAPGVSLDDIAQGPAIYLRLPLAEAASPERIRKAAARSLRDGFTSCLFVGPSNPPSEGTACVQTSQCGPGEVCSDWRVCAAPAHPYTASLLYEGVRVLQPEWRAALEAANDDLEVRAIELDLDDVGKHEAVAAVELTRRSKYFALVLDEPAADEAAAPEPAVSDESPEERLQTTDHRVRVGLWDIQRAVPLAILQLEAAGRFVRLGSKASPDDKTKRAQQRQANNCAIAAEVRAALAAGRPDPGQDALADAPGGLPAAP
jgi:hypothetical protein